MNAFSTLSLFIFFREKLKKILAIETARAAVVTQWTKKVVVEKQTLANAEDPLVSITHSSICLDFCLL